MARIYTNPDRGPNLYNMDNHLLQITDLQTFFFTHLGVVKAVDGVSLCVDSGEMVGVVGESGCGKSVLARTIMRLIPNPPGRVVGGEISLQGESLLSFSEKRMQQIRGNTISMIFQEPMTSLNPVYTVGTQIAEVFRKHQKLGKKEALDCSVDMLKKVGIPSPETRAREYPFQMSGGMRQRIVIAMALACRPKLILADEPTTALDVTVQAQILNLISELEQELGTSMILITHDLGVIFETVKRVFVMYAGKVVEQADVADLFNRPYHPYTEGLMFSVPSLEEDQNKDIGRLKEIPGIVPNLSSLPPGCSFAPRCHKRLDICGYQEPKIFEVSPNRGVKCWLYN